MNAFTAPIAPSPRERRIDVACRLRDLLRVSIAEMAGATGAHERGPLVESELQAAFGTSRNTVRDALELLRAEGLIERVPGVGTFAVAPKAQHRFDRLQGLSEGIEHGTRRIAHELLAFKTAPATATVAAALGVELGEPVVLVERRSHLDGEPVAIGTHWLPAWAGAQLRRTDLVHELYTVYEQLLGLTIEGSEAVIEAVLADAPVAEQLRVAEGAALLRFERRMVLDDRRTIELGFVRARGDRLALASSLVRALPHERTDTR